MGIMVEKDEQRSQLGNVLRLTFVSAPKARLIRKITTLKILHYLRVRRRALALAGFGLL